MSKFQKTGNTLTITAATSAPTPAQLTTNDEVRSSSAVVTNVGAVTAFVGWGQNAGDATAAAVIPVVGTSSGGYPVLAGTKETVDIPSGWYVTATTGSSTASIYVTPGYEC